MKNESGRTEPRMRVILFAVACLCVLAGWSLENVSCSADSRVKRDLKARFSAIRKLIIAGDDEKGAEAIKRLLVLREAYQKEAKTERFFHELMAFAAGHQSEDLAFAVMLSFAMVGENPGTLIRAAQNALESGDQELSNVAAGVLGHAEATGGSKTDFSVYRRHFSTTPEPSVPFLVHLYNRSPEETLRVLLNAYEEPPERVRLLHKLREIEMLIWRRRNGIESPPPVSAGAHLEHFANVESWWVRLYPVFAMQRHDFLRENKLLRRLERDPHPAVREAASQRDSNAPASRDRARVDATGRR